MLSYNINAETESTANITQHKQGKVAKNYNIPLNKDKIILLKKCMYAATINMKLHFLLISK